MFDLQLVAQRQDKALGMLLAVTDEEHPKIHTAHADIGGAILSSRLILHVFFRLWKETTVSQREREKTCKPKKTS